MPSLAELRALIYDVRDHVDHVYAPLFVVQATQDKVIESIPQTSFITKPNRKINKSNGMKNQGMSLHLDRKKSNFMKTSWNFLNLLIGHV